MDTDALNDIVLSPLQNYKLVNTHPMVTRSKASIVKPKKFSFTILTLPEPSTYKEATSILKWEHTMKVEFNALIHNNT